MKKKKTEQPVQLSSVPARWKMTTMIFLHIFTVQQLRPTTAVRVHHPQQDQRHVQLNIDRSGGDDVTIVPSEAYLKAEEARRLAEREGYFVLSGATWSYLADFFSGVVEQAVNTSSLLFFQGTETMLGTSIKTSEELQNQKSICSSPGNKESRIGCGVAGKLQDEHEEHLQDDGDEIRTTSTSSTSILASSKSKDTKTSSASSTTSAEPSIISTTTAPATKESSTAGGPSAATGTDKDVQEDDGSQTDTNACRRAGGSTTGRAGTGTADDKDVVLLPALGTTAPSSRTPQDQDGNTGDELGGVEPTEGEKKGRRAEQVVSPVNKTGDSRDEERRADKDGRDLTRLQSGEDKAAATKHDSTSNTNRTDTSMTDDQNFPALGNKSETTSTERPATAPSSPGARESAGGGTRNRNKAARPRPAVEEDPYEFHRGETNKNYTTTVVSSFLQPQQQQRVQQQQAGADDEAASTTSSLVQEKQTAGAGSTSSSQDQQAAPSEPSQLVLGVHPQLFPLLKKSEEQSGSSRRCVTQIFTLGGAASLLPQTARRSTTSATSSASQEVPKSNHLSVNQYRAYRAEIEKLTGLDKEVVGADAPAAPTTASGASSAAPGRGRLLDPHGEKPKLFVVFGNTGTGKSTLADRIIEMAGMDPAVKDLPQNKKEFVPRYLVDDLIEPQELFKLWGWVFLNAVGHDIQLLLGKDHHVIFRPKQQGNSGPPPPLPRPDQLRYESFKKAVFQTRDPTTGQIIHQLPDIYPVIQQVWDKFRRLLPDGGGKNSCAGINMAQLLEVRDPLGVDLLDFGPVAVDGGGRQTPTLSSNFGKDMRWIIENLPRRRDAPEQDARTQVAATTGGSLAAAAGTRSEGTSGGSAAGRASKTARGDEEHKLQMEQAAVAERLTIVQEAFGFINKDEAWRDLQDALELGFPADNVPEVVRKSIEFLGLQSLLTMEQYKFHNVGAHGLAFSEWVKVNIYHKRGIVQEFLSKMAAAMDDLYRFARKCGLDTLPRGGEGNKSGRVHLLGASRARDLAVFLEKQAQEQVAAKEANLKKVVNDGMMARPGGGPREADTVLHLKNTAEKELDETKRQLAQQQRQRALADAELSRARGGPQIAETGRNTDHEDPGRPRLADHDVPPLLASPEDFLDSLMGASLTAKTNLLIENNLSPLELLEWLRRDMMPETVGELNDVFDIWLGFNIVAMPGLWEDRNIPRAMRSLQQFQNPFLAENGVRLPKVANADSWLLRNPLNTVWRTLQSGAARQGWDAFGEQQYAGPDFHHLIVIDNNDKVEKNELIFVAEVGTTVTSTGHQQPTTTTQGVSFAPLVNNAAQRDHCPREEVFDSEVQRLVMDFVTWKLSNRNYLKFDYRLACQPDAVFTEDAADDRNTHRMKYLCRNVNAHSIMMKQKKGHVDPKEKMTCYQSYCDFEERRRVDGTEVIGPPRPKEIFQSPFETEGERTERLKQEEKFKQEKVKMKQSAGGLVQPPGGQPPGGQPPGGQQAPGAQPPGVSQPPPPNIDPNAVNNGGVVAGQQSPQGIMLTTTQHQQTYATSGDPPAPEPDSIRCC
ncbi:unnamed protein product [Amoebophrya sp. A120]|nr:unnamed protein product [Amoebophrya sp. A120]|eukprot:GSA120T00015871001.1